MENQTKTLPSDIFAFTHKTCPICGENKEVNEFPMYFSKPRNKYRIGNYCRPCGRKEAKPRAAKNYQDNLEKRKQYAKDYRANPQNKEKRKKLETHFKKKYREELQDCYVREILQTRCDIPIEVSRELPELVEAKRLQIKIKRRIKILKKDER